MPADRPKPLDRRSGAVRVRAFAKINLTLRVLGVRSDGYHELRTTFQSIALHDTLTFTRRRGPFQIESDAASCPVDDTNLVWRAAVALGGAAGRAGRPIEPDGIHVRLQKRIPQQAGLGGGSSDAAATLRALSALWRIALPPERLTAVAREIGADVPYFLQGGTMLGVERGDVLFPLVDAPSSWVVLVQPRFGVSTAEAYGWWDRAGRLKEEPGPHGAPAVRPPALYALPRSEVVNDLQPPVAERHPIVRAVIDELARAGARHAALSGSGSTVFGLFATEARARAAARRLATAETGTRTTKTLSRTQFQARSRPAPCG
jgi:4-diphosphocytidyl-2-C-methyl-D-erythritol kinase